MLESARRRRPLLMLAVVAAAVCLLLTVAGVRSRLGPTEADCTQAVNAAGGHWCRIYEENFATPAARGSFVNASADDWHLRRDRPYAGSLRSYPDGWGTTSNWSLNYASKTADVVPEALGARGVFRVHGHSEQVAGRVRSLGGSFYPVLDPLAAVEERQMAQTYGRYTVRFATTGGYRPNGAGTFPLGSAEPSYGTAFLLWPTNDRWAEGEIDYPELVWGAAPSGAVHEIGRPQVNSDTFEVSASTDARWNTATIEWTPGLLVFYWNGKKVRRVTTDVPSTPFRWGFQSGGTLGTPAADLSGYLYVDSISIDAYLPAGRLR